MQEAWIKKRSAAAAPKRGRETATKVGTYPPTQDKVPVEDDGYKVVFKAGPEMKVAIEKEEKRI